MMATMWRFRQDPDTATVDAMGRPVRGSGRVRIWHLYFDPLFDTVYAWPWQECKRAFQYCKVHRDVIVVSARYALEDLGWIPFDGTRALTWGNLTVEDAIQLDRALRAGALENVYDLRSTGTWREGYWAHVMRFNDLTAESLESLFRLRGEIAVSEWDLEATGWYFLAHTKHPIWAAAIFYGPALFWPGDNWSDYTMKGLRYPTSTPQEGHSEAFLSPAAARPVALAYYMSDPNVPYPLNDRRWRPYFLQLRALADAVGLPLVSLHTPKPKPEWAVRQAEKYMDWDVKRRWLAGRGR
jgi:hypothetical protein